MRAFVALAKSASKSIGFVPTMGALHAGHISLVQAGSMAQNHVTIVSIFVNPLQFNQVADFEKYPTQYKADIALLEEAGVQALFLPTEQEMYDQSKAESLKVEIGYLDTVLEGAKRPGHFSGVCVVVAKLLNIVQPDRAYFGTKDLQQVAVVRKLVADLDFATEIIGIPILREANGLAMSSRNARLSPQARNLAAGIYASMCKAKAEAGTDCAHALSTCHSLLSAIPGLDIEYIEVVDTHTFRKPETNHAGQSANLSLCVAVWLDGVRLIDNVQLGH